jgi:glycosyltransferase involved in cell wall biosynthesis
MTATQSTDMNSNPRVSVIIPCFNLGEFLDEAVESVLAQSYQDFEILIVDDGSTDAATIELLDGYARPKTAVFRTGNRRLAAARNFLISQARGHYICALDADDRLHPEYLERTVGVLDADPSLTFASTRLQMFGAETSVWPRDQRCDLGMLLCDDTIITPALVRRAAVLACGGYDERMPHQGDEDWDLWIGMVERGHRGVILPDVLFHYRRRPNAMCVECTTGQVHLELMDYLIRKHEQSYREHLTDVLLWKDARLLELRSANDRMEHDIESRLAPVVERRHRELELIREKLDHARLQRKAQDACAAVPVLEREVERQRRDLDTVRLEHARAHDEVAALRSSISWRLTAPLRMLWDVVSNTRVERPR